MLTGLADFLLRRNLQLDATHCDLIAMTVFKAANELLWLALMRDHSQRQALVAETKILITAYLQTSVDRKFIVDLASRWQ